jgi:hypothetical protein
MSNAKKKSSGWQPSKKRGTWQERRARQNAAHTAEVRRDCDGLGLWRSCPSRRCQRVRGCVGDPWRCKDQRRPKSLEKSPDKRDGDSRPAAATSAAAAIGNAAPPVMSAAEAAAAIAASIANLGEV